MRFSIASLGEEPAGRFGEFVRLCELLGYESFCHSDEKWTRDVYVRLAVAAASTSRIGLGITVTDPYTRHPALTAQAAATLGEASSGRLRVFLGAGSHFETLPGYASVRPVVGIRESIELMRRLWDGERVTLDGEIVRFTGGELDFPVAPEHRPGVWVAGRGRQILRMAGQVADGVLIGSFATPAGIRYAKELVAGGLERAGRTWDDIGLASWLYVSVLESADDDVPAGVRRGVSHALWSSRAVANQLLESVDLSGEDEFLAFMKDAPHEWSPAVMAELRRLIPRVVIEQFAVVGTADQVAAQLIALRDEGVQECIAWPFPADGMDVEDFAVQFAHEVVPRVRGRRSRGAYRLVD
ncbi:LLM class flavin-dependent oxidoreductase [Jiangella asiatica]|uniref:LLM class flavin-dependent oxidoreductase n=1 Tax=Jiangella asiatica TaxID=2530372 RepID=A0A4R5CQJ4_9ACTN|nr:LLM class flavin-dependent oxidoreductase [Jiangella asiatica]TDE00684.1 LLM class flavin-dependent oxidoreductase [Jiangella asiatica]